MLTAVAVLKLHRPSIVPLPEFPILKISTPLKLDWKILFSTLYLIEPESVFAPCKAKPLLPGLEAAAVIVLPSAPLFPPTCTLFTELLPKAKYKPYVFGLEKLLDLITKVLFDVP